jgi:hypothetical protein
MAPVSCTTLASERRWRVKHPEQEDHIPRTIMFFSGNLFPLATESSMELHISFFASSFLLSGPEPVDVVVYVDTRCEFDVVMSGCCRPIAAALEIGERVCSHC